MTSQSWPHIRFPVERKIKPTKKDYFIFNLTPTFLKQSFKNFHRIIFLQQKKTLFKSLKHFVKRFFLILI